MASYKSKVTKNDSELEVFAATIFAEARDQKSKAKYKANGDLVNRNEDGRVWVAWVIKNRASLNLEYMGGKKIKDVCLKNRQFECWDDREYIDIPSNEKNEYIEILNIARKVINNEISDPTNKCDHYNNVEKEKKRLDKLYNVELKWIVGDHHFYKMK